MYWAIGLLDINQPHQAIRRNFPVLGNVRYLMETIRPEIRQYFVEGDYEAAPYARKQRSVVYQRAKNSNDSMAFGTRFDVYSENYVWGNHSMWPQEVDLNSMRTIIGGPDCRQPYSASLLNISAMSFGALSPNAILALNNAAKNGGFYHNTGEGGISRYHKQPGGDIVWNVGTGYFGCRDMAKGTFCSDTFSSAVSSPQVKMVEIKLSQGAKPGHGGLLPKSKISPDIADARGIDPSKDCHSPARHSAFENYTEMVQFIQKLRDLSDGKPIGVKLCVGRAEEVAAMIHAMKEHGIYPDFITVDGGEGGTGAAPVEFSDHVGMPLSEGLSIVHGLLRGAGVRDRVRLIASGKVLSGFSLVRTLALGADACNAARAMMFALGCIQALKCNTNKCPTGITTQDEELQKGLVVGDKATRVQTYHAKTIQSAAELIGALGISNPSMITPDLIQVRVSHTKVKRLSEIYPSVPIGSLLDGTAPQSFMDVWRDGKVMYENES